MKKALCALIALVMAFAPCAVAFAAEQSDIDALRGTKLYVYNWGEYISDGEDDSLDVNAAFEEKYGIEVVYDNYDTNEVMYSKLKGGGVSYDVVIPSDYMIERMIAEDMLEKLDFSNIPNYKYIPEKYRNLAHDPTNEYSVPYTVGMVGLIYNTKMVEEAPDSWTALWDERYANNILMINNPRDAFAIAQSILGMDYNNESPAAWRVAAELLKEQKNIVPTYVNDEIFLKMESGEAALAPYFAGDFLTMYDNNPDLAFVYPKEGVNFFVDAACILKGAKNKLAAELYINFLLDPEVALANAEYICYASPHTEVYSNPEYTFYQNEILYPEDGKFKTQLFLNLSPEILSLMSTLWDDVKNYVPSSGSSNYAFFFGGDSQSSANTENGEKMTAETRKYAMYIGIFVLICVLYIVFRYARKKYREKV
ncbi:MAG: spermidine/putrescine ABC transporter substrate-binding protein [Clostridiaceae bacterium]|nr:spermidine/putrescine ABC transporter substrate-binding protein [Clostridiaceae bacterium]MDO4494838.1 spermidine/putrescine ABC transporter substrate-binding protein [Clostridiaceae bacterium]